MDKNEIIIILDQCEELYWATEDPDEGGRGICAGDALEAIREKLQILRELIGN